MRKLISPEEAERRLRVIFPRAAFDSVFSSPLAAMAVSALIYVDAVCGSDDETDAIQWARPATVLWMSKGALAHSAEAERVAWRTASTKGNKQVAALHTETWGETFRPSYRDNSRETLRDETFKEWQSHNAIRQRVDIPTTSSQPRWALLDHFADLFDPDLSGEGFETAARTWRDRHLDPGARLKTAFALKAETDKHAVTVVLPNSGGATRKLEPCMASHVIKGVVETWSAARMQKPVVLAISEPGDKVHLGEEIGLQGLGITIDVNNVLPDVIMADIGTDPVRFWIIEVAASDGVVTAARRTALLKWAAKQNIREDRCSFLTAFEWRNSDSARRRLKDLASGTWAWFAAEPYHELAWYEVVPGAGGA
ncbi:BsuBI/PstI family type II restriction endonuclease [Streptomyces sp. NPDC001215]